MKVFIVVIAASAVAAVLFRRHIVRLGRLIAWLDAFGLVGPPCPCPAGIAPAARTRKVHLE